MAINPQSVSDNYMRKFEKLVDKFNSSNIEGLVDKINEAIEKSDKESIKHYYSQISDWNIHVSSVEVAREAAINQYPHLRLPSVSAYNILFDNVEKVWRFNTDSLS